MVQIKWLRLNATTGYYWHNHYLLLRRRVREYFVYSIWLNNEMRHITYNDYEFAQLAHMILNNETVAWEKCA